MKHPVALAIVAAAKARGLALPIAGHLVMSDLLRDGAAEMMQALREQGVARILLATGDRAEVAPRVTEGLGLDGMRAGLTPDK